MLNYYWNICQVTEGGRPLLIIHDALGHHKFQPLKLNSAFGVSLWCQGCFRPSQTICDSIQFY